jgi:hypothetical protein
VSGPEVVFAAVPVAFSGGPLNRQVHVWSQADVAATEAVRVGSGGYVRSRRWRTQQRTHRPVTYSWTTELGAGDFLDMPTLTVSIEPGARF